MSSEYEVPCPFPECGELLAITFTQCYTLSPIEVELSPLLTEVPSPATAHTASWQIECAGGHTLLVPGHLGCPCKNDDQDGPACPHKEAEYDWSDEYRTFRAEDLARLSVIILRLTEATP